MTRNTTPVDDNTAVAISMIREIGYEQAGCNDEGFVDFDEAVYIYNELVTSTQWAYGYGTVATDEIIAAARIAWNREFPNGTAF